MESGAGTAAAEVAAAAAPPAAAETLTQKRNTDCVYFLASPLTCKKGNECEYRHSEGARTNPRDCWYWLNGTCLNPKCPFRHPPLDDFYDPAVALMPPMPMPMPMPMPGFVPYNAPKPKQCYFFQKGNCLKGDTCPYLHGVQAPGNSHTDQGQNISSATQPVEMAPQNNPLQGTPFTPAEKLKVTDARLTVAALPADHSNVELLSIHAVSSSQGHKSTNVIQSDKEASPVDENQHDLNQNSLPTGSGIEQGWDQNDQAPDDQQENSRDGDDFLGESSPGFDVLVDNDGDEPGYMHPDDDFRVGRDMYPVDDFDFRRVDYGMVAHHEREQYRDSGEPDPLRPPYDLYDRKRRRMSSERNPDHTMMSDRRFLPREHDFPEMDRSDLRHRLSKYRRRNHRSAVSPDGSGDWNRREDRFMDEGRMNGSRHAVSPSHRGDWYRKDERYMEERPNQHGRSRHNGSPRRSFVSSSRLQGRINLPGRTDSADMLAEQENDRRRSRGRRSPSRDFHPRHQDRIGRRPSDFVPNARVLSSQVARKDEADSEFRGPNVLSGVHHMGINGMRLERSAKGHHAPHSSSDFEGPKPLSEILKKKREAATGSDTVCNGNLGNGTTANRVLDEEAADLIPANDADDDGINVDVVDDQEELDDYNSKDDGYSYLETIEGKDAEENLYEDDEEYGDDEEDDFAQKVGIMFSET